MPRKPQPVPPIYQPEVAAEAIYFAAHHKRRQIYVGMSTVIVIQANKIVPWLGDWYLGKTGYQAQQYDGRVPPDRRDNLVRPVGGDHGAHGEFDQRAHGRSIELWLTTHRNLLAVAGIGAAAMAIIGAGMRSARG